MLFSLLVSLFTARIVLDVLGAEDYGIYHLVAGFITLFAFLNSSMSSATQRFLAFAIGKKDKTYLTNVFSMSFNIHLIIGVLIVVLAETIGLWFVNTQLNLPSGRLVAAKWVYHFSILTMFLTIITVPFNAVIIARERMNIYAFISILETILKLVIVYMLYITSYDKLEFYAFLTLIVTLIVSVFFRTYCLKYFYETKFRWFWDKPLFKTLFFYAGWNLWGNLAYVLYGQGINVLLNIFFGPTINAARAIAYQIQGAVGGFVSNFQIAINPQIVKSFASEDLKYMHKLIFQGSKYSFFLLFTMCLPILLNTETILILWLKIVPEYTVLFTQLVLINILIDTISGPLMTAAQASGKIKLYQIVIGGLLLLILPISLILFKMGYPPQVTLYVSITISVIALFSRLIIISPLVKLCIRSFISNVVFRIVPVILVSLIIPKTLKHFLSDDILGLFIVLISSFLSVIFTIFLFGMNKKERIFIYEKIRYKLKK
jgi:O-antigen/teichoic acid export membrane protein